MAIEALRSCCVDSLTQRSLGTRRCQDALPGRAAPSGRAPSRSAGHETRRTSSGSLCNAPLPVAAERQHCIRLRHGLDLHPGASLNPLSHKHLRTRAEKTLVEAVPEYRQRLAQLNCVHVCLLRSPASAPRTSRSPVFRARERRCRSTWLVPVIGSSVPQSAPNPVVRQRTETDRHSLSPSALTGGLLPASKGGLILDSASEPEKGSAACWLTDVVHRPLDAEHHGIQPREMLHAHGGKSRLLHPKHAVGPGLIRILPGSRSAYSSARVSRRFAKTEQIRDTARSQQEACPAAR